MGLFSKIKERNEYWQKRFYDAKEKNLTERIERAEINKARTDRLNALQNKLTKLEGNKGASGGFMENVLKNSYRNLASEKKGKKKDKWF